MLVVVFNALGTDVHSSKIKLSAHLNFLLPSVEEELKWKFELRCSISKFSSPQLVRGVRAL